MEIRGNRTKGIEVETKGKLATLRFQDSGLNFYVTDSLKETLKSKLHELIDQGCEHIVLSLANVRIIDSCGVGLVIVANNVVAARGTAKLYVTNLRPFILKIFDILRISKHLSIFDTEAEAVVAARETNDE